MTAEIRERTGIDAAMIGRLVDAFYDRARADPMLGPIFASRIGDWGLHLERMRAFWSSVTLLTGAYHGQPMQKHLDLALGAYHFDRWLELFEATAREQCPATAAEVFIERARRVAQSLEQGIAAKGYAETGTGNRRWTSHRDSHFG